MAGVDPDILNIWGECVLDSDNNLLIEIAKLRGHSIASMQMEKYKKEKATCTTKKRSLRKELQWNHNNFFF